MVEKTECMKRKSENPNYIYFTGKQGRWNKINFEEKNIAEINVLEVILYGKEKTKAEFQTKHLKRVQRKLRKYDLKNCVVGAEEEMAELLEMEDLLFQARKLEFLRYREVIFKKLKKEGKEGKRSSMLLMVNSSKWNTQDILTILVTAKDYYEDIMVVMKEEYFDAEQLQNVMYEDWGVMLHFIKEEERKEADFGLILSEECEKDIYQKAFLKVSYQIAERESGKVKRRKLLRLTVEKEPKNGSIYSGLVYEREGRRIPYRMGVNIAAQNPALYDKFHISAVAIYEQEW